MYMYVILQHEESVIERLKRTPDFSSVFKILLLHKDTQFPGSMPGTGLWP